MNILGRSSSPVLAEEEGSANEAAGLRKREEEGGGGCPFCTPLPAPMEWALYEPVTLKRPCGSFAVAALHGARALGNSSFLKLGRRVP